MIKFSFGRGSGTLHVPHPSSGSYYVGAGLYHGRGRGAAFTQGNGGWSYSSIYTLVNGGGNGGGFYPHYAILGGSCDSDAER